MKCIEFRICENTLCLMLEQQQQQQQQHNTILFRWVQFVSTLAVQMPKPAITFCGGGGGKLVKSEQCFSDLFCNNEGRLTGLQLQPFPSLIIVCMPNKNCYIAQTHPLDLLFSNFVRPTKIIKYIICCHIVLVLTQAEKASQRICLQVEQSFCS